MAGHTIRWKPGSRMTRTGRRLVFVEVAVGTFISNPVKTQGGFRGMTFLATDDGMIPQQGKAIDLVQFCHLVHQPVFRTVATGTVIANRHLVQVGMAGNTGTLRSPEDQCFMTCPAVHDFVPAGQGKVCLLMVEALLVRRRLRLAPKFTGDIPTFGGVTGSAIHFEGCTVWGLGVHDHHQPQQQYH